MCSVLVMRFAGVFSFYKKQSKQLLLLVEWYYSIRHQDKSKGGQFDKRTNQ